MTSNEETKRKIMWNLTASMAPFVDSHQLLRLVEFQINCVDPPIFDQQQLDEQKLNILKTLDMVDYTWELECQIRRLPEGTELPEEYQNKKDKVIQNLGEYEERVDNVKMKIRDASEIFTQGKDNNRLWVMLKEEYKFEEEDLNDLFIFARMQYNTGDYSECDDTLYLYSLIAPYDHKQHLSALWGKAASEILQIDDEGKSKEKFDAASKTIDHLKETIDKMNEARQNPLVLLQWRSWLLHWSLFVYFSDEAKENKAKNTELMINLFLGNEEYKNAIETICPWLLRYLAVVIVTSKTLEKKHTRLNQLIKLIEQEHYNYSDPITDFLLCLNVHYDFESAQTHLVQSKDVLRSDFFLHNFVDDFIEHGRILMFEMFCKIHQKIKVETIAEKLNMTQEDAEIWIVELIRNASLHAKIDSENGNIIMGSDPIVPYQQIIAKTNNLALTTQMLLRNLERKLKPNSEVGKVPSWARHGSSSNKFEK